MRFNGQGYLESCGKGNKFRKPPYKNAWIIKHIPGKNVGALNIRSLVFHPSFVGKKVRIKLEVVEDEEDKVLEPVQTGTDQTIAY